jgi:hypothetical protein
MDHKPKERPFLFNGDMVRAILEGRKTQTRRIVKTRIPSDAPRNINPHTLEVEDGGGYGFYDDNGDVHKAPCCPGELLWIRETWGKGSENNVCHSSDEMIFYRATDPGWDDNDTGFKWRPSIHMPRWASRITLKVTSVRIERLNQINSLDAESEGCPVSYNPETGYHEIHTGHGTPIYWFADLWESIYGKGSWDENPFVWVIDFEVVQQ